MRQATKRVRVQSSDVAEGIGVHAPSVVQTNDKAAQNWFALSNALNVGMQSGAQIIKAKQQDDLVAGAEAAALGNVTEQNLGQNQDKSKAWLKGARSKLAERRAIADAAGATEFYQQNVDKNLPVEEVEAQMRGYWDKLYAGMDGDMLSAVAPHMDSAHQRILSAHATLQSAETAAEIDEAVLVSTTQAFRDGAIQTAEDWAMVRQDAVTLVGKDKANDLLMSSIEQYVAESNDPEVWDAPYLEKLRTNPKYAGRAAKSIDDAQREQSKAFQQATVLERAAIEADLTERSQAGDATVLTDLRRQFEAGMVGEEIVRTVTKAYANAVVSGTQERVYVDRFMAATTSTLDLSDDEYNDTAKAALAKLQESDPENGMAVFLDGVAKNGRMPKFLKRVLDNASPSNPEAFNQAYSVYSTLRQADPAGFHRLVTDENQTLFDSYEVLVNDYGDPQVAIQKLAEVDTSLVANVDRQEYNDALDDAISEVEDGPFFNNLDEADPYTRKIVKKRMNHMISMGYSPEKAAEFAVTDIQKRYTIAKGKLWPNSAGFTMDPDVVLEATAEQFKAYDPEGRDVEIVPVMGKPGYAWVRPEGSMPFAGEQVRISRMEANYRENQRRRRDEEIAAGQASVKADMLLKAKQRATGLYSLPFDKSVTGVKMREEQDEAWNKLSPAAQQEVIREIEAEAEAAKQKREANLDRRRDVAGEFASPTGIL